MLRILLVALFGVMSVAAIGCDDDDAEINTPAGDVKVDTD